MLSRSSVIRTSRARKSGRTAARAFDAPTSADAMLPHAACHT
ncbi:Uncharacterised protein [Mycobacterium tuberculosis]|uniref:Uncharacterized protein n=1 Tax=Mycobacterium tuberculosis TaxID=1773 RepID=A0A0U0RZ50_MYCTX|nr:Uncharacterised protein [Mycobacterium tuberculosis]